MRAKRIALVTGLVVMLVSPTISQTGCFPGYPIVPAADSLFGIVGKVYEWVNPPPGAAGAVFYKEGEGEGRSAWDVLDEMEEAAFQKYELIPLEGVEVLADWKPIPVKRDLWEIRASSDAEGLFGGGTVGQPWAENWVLKFSKSGYVEVTLEIQQDSLNYALVVIMVREDSLQ